MYLINIKNNKQYLLLLILLMITFHSGCKDKTLKETYSGGDLIVKGNNQQTSESNSNTIIAEVTELVFWESESNGHTIRWSNKDLITIDDLSTETKLFSMATKKDIDTTLKANASENSYPKTNPFNCKEPNGELCFYERKFRLLSVVGNLVSFEDIYTGESGEMLRGESSRYTTIDISKRSSFWYEQTKYGTNFEVPMPKPKQVVDLEDIFGEEVVLAVILSNAEIKWALQEKDLSQHPQTTKELRNSIETIEKDGSILYLEDYEHYIPSDFLTRFAIDKVIGDKVYINIAFPTAKSSHFNKEIELEFIIPSDLRDSLLLSSTKKNGFLGKDAEKMFPNKFTRIKYKF